MGEIINYPREDLKEMRNSKFVAVGLAVVMTLTACGGNKPAETTAASTVAETTTAVETTVAETTSVEETTAQVSEGVKTDLNVATSDKLGVTIRYPGEKVDMKFIESSEETDLNTMNDADCYVMVDPTGFTSLMLYAAAADLYGDELESAVKETTEVAESETESIDSTDHVDFDDETGNTGEFTYMKWYGSAGEPEDSMLGANWVIMGMKSTEPEQEQKSATLIMANIKDTNIMLMFLDTCPLAYDGMILEYQDESITLDMSDEVDNADYMKQSLNEFSEGMNQMGEDVSNAIEDYNEQAANAPSSQPLLDDDGIYYKSASGKEYHLRFMDTNYSNKDGQSLSDQDGVGLRLDDYTYEFLSTESHPVEPGLEEDTTHAVPFGKLYVSGEDWIWDSEDGFSVAIHGGEAALEAVVDLLEVE